mgnify:CR=1 FL=1
MKKILLIVFLLFILFPISSSFSQEKYDKPSTLGIVLTNSDPFYYKDEDGYTVIIGEVENTKEFDLTTVTIRGFFYDEFSEQPIEANLGTTIFDVIPSHETVPYIIKSPNPNAAITFVSVKLQGFTSAPTKNEEFSIESEISVLNEQIKITGKLTNNSSEEASQTKIHLAFYDAFQRIIWASSIHLEEPIVGDSSVNFEFDKKFDQPPFSYKIFAESDNAFSITPHDLFPHPEILTKIITINNISINDFDGNKLTGASQGTTINIESNVSIQYSSDQETFEQPYIYYAQVKQSEKGFVEFIGKFEGTFQSTGMQSPLAEWTPQNKGLYFIETFVWDPNAVPLASKGPIMLVAVT